MKDLNSIRKKIHTHPTTELVVRHTSDPSQIVSQTNAPRNAALHYDNYKHNHNDKNSSGAQQLRCEVCGRKIHGKPNRVIIEEAKLTVCSECSRLGTGVWEEPKPQTTSTRLGSQPAPLRIQMRKPAEPPPDTVVELTEGFSAKIRRAREKLGLSHEDLGKKLNLKVSLLRKIETGKMTPDNKIATMLEHALKVKLIVPAKEEKIPHSKLPKVERRELTLGDVIQLDKKGREKEDMAGRKPS
jgi:putative transcription factor